MLETNLGVYRCGGINFPSKVAACVHSERTGQPVEWWFHNETFEAYPWHIEPTETLDELYDRRARELREQYDYILISYSGGSDSNNVVQSFMRQGLHIDEIVTNHMTEATKKTLVLDPTVKDSWNFNAEHQLNAVPRLNELRLALPRTKFTVLEVSDLVLNSLQKFEDAEWVLNRTGHVSVGLAFRYNYFYFSELQRRFDRGQRVAIVTGVDKAKTYLDQNWNFWTWFPDQTVNIVTINDFNVDYTNVRMELFYWGATTAPIVAKQAHVIRRWLERNPRYIPAWRANSYATFRRLQEPLLRNLLYTNWNSEWYQADKSTNIVYNEFDAWFHKEPEFQHQRELWHRGINYLKQTMPSFIEVKDFETGTLKMFRHDYCCGKIATNFLPEINKNS